MLDVLLLEGRMPAKLRSHFLFALPFDALLETLWVSFCGSGDRFQDSFKVWRQPRSPKIHSGGCVPKSECFFVFFQHGHRFEASRNTFEHFAVSLISIFMYLSSVAPYPLPPYRHLLPPTAAEILQG